MPLKSYAEIAQTLEDAMLAVASGTLQSYSLNGKSFSKHNLKDLADLYRQYRQWAEEETHGGTTLAVLWPGSLS